MKRCAFLTMENLDDFECYDHLLVEPMGRYGWQVDEIPWRSSSVDWDEYDVVIIRSPWDYQDEPDRFMRVLKRIAQSSARLENSLDLVRWNLDKRYLEDMQQAGIPIVETRWQERLKPDDIPRLFRQLDSEELIIKPVISANADHTYRLKKEIDSETEEKLLSIFKNRTLMVQPFMQNIVSEGEFSLFYFAGVYSHAIVKTPKAGDFRVQEEHGGRLKLIEPEPELQDIGSKTMAALPETPLYGRVDFVRTARNNFVLMELELIEPSLYFNMDPQSPKRFARLFDEWMKERN